jgi:hypothetical protein
MMMAGRVLFSRRIWLNIYLNPLEKEGQEETEQLGCASFPEPGSSCELVRNRWQVRYTGFPQGQSKGAFRTLGTYVGCPRWVPMIGIKWGV